MSTLCRVYKMLCIYLLIRYPHTFVYLHWNADKYNVTVFKQDRNLEQTFNLTDAIAL